MKSRNVLACFLLAIIIALPLVSEQVLGQIPMQAVQSISLLGTISHPPAHTFIYQGANVLKNNILPGYTSTAPNFFSITQDLGINAILLVHGTEGGTPFSISANQNWAQNFDNFLATCSSHGVKVVIQRLGTPSYPDLEFGINYDMDINVAKSMVDKLAGNNALNHNFLTDPRIAFWTIANEPTLSDTNPAIFNWLCTMGDYFLSKGANVACVGGYFADSGNNAYWIQRFAGHQNFINTHHYNMGIVQTAQNNGQSVYTATYNIFNEQLTSELAVRGNIPLSNIILGEAGVGHEPNFVEMGNIYHLTEETRGEYYRALFQVCKDKGIGGVFPYLLFDAYYPDSGEIEPWGAITWDGSTYFTNITEQYKAFY
jgi:hypothetical protein